GVWVSAFVPLRDPAGRLDGVLGVDFDARAFTATIADARFRMVGLLAVALVVLLGLSTLNAVALARVADRKQVDQALRESEERLRFLNDLGEATNALARPEQIMDVMTRKLSEHLRASRCAYAVV